MRANIVCAIALGAASLSARARALAGNDALECTAAYDEAQILQKKGKYLEAAQRGLACMKPVCGNVVSTECAKLYEVIQNLTPTVVLGAHDGDSNDLVDVRVSIDGVLVQEKLDGTPITIDPGPHLFRFEAKGLPPVERPYGVRAGEKFRIITETLGEKKKPKPQPVEAPQQVPEAPSVSPKTLRVSSYVLGGFGAIALGGFGLLRWSGMQDYNKLETQCVPHCTADDINTVKQKLVFSYVSLGVGVAALGTSITLFALQVGKQDSAQVRLAPRASGGVAQFTMSF